MIVRMKETCLLAGVPSLFSIALRQLPLEIAQPVAQQQDIEKILLESQTSLIHDIQFHCTAKMSVAHEMI